jgi:hypothetical protein
MPYVGTATQTGGGMVRNVLQGATVAAETGILRSFQLLNGIWNEYRWYLLELRRKRKDPEIKDEEHSYISTSAATPFGKLIRGKSTSAPIEDPALAGLEKDPPLQRFIDEIDAGGADVPAARKTRRNLRRPLRFANGTNI